MPILMSALEKYKTKTPKISLSKLERFRNTDHKLSMTEEKERRLEPKINQDYKPRSYERTTFADREFSAYNPVTNNYQYVNAKDIGMTDKEVTDYLKGANNSKVDSYFKLQSEDYWKKHPILNWIAGPKSALGKTNSAAVAVNDVAGARMRQTSFGDQSYYKDARTRKTTGNAALDTVANIAGSIESFGMPSGGGAPSMAGPVRQAAEAVTRKLATSKIAPEVLKKSGLLQGLATGVIESLPYTGWEAGTNNYTPEETLKAAGLNAAMGAGGETLGYGIGKAVEKVKKMSSKEYLSAFSKTLPDDEGQLNKIIRDLEVKKATTTDEKALKKIDLRLLAAKSKVPAQFEGVKPGDINYKPVSVGMQTQIVNQPVQPKASKFTFENPEMEAGHIKDTGLREMSVPEKINEIATNIKNLFTRPIKDLPVTKENADIYYGRYGLLNLQKAKARTGDDTVRVLSDITKDLDKNSFDMFSRKVLLDDLAEEAKAGNSLPKFGDYQVTSDDITKELGRLDLSMSQSAKDAMVKRQKYWAEIKDDYVNSLNEIGVKTELNKDNYFRHQVLDYMNAQETKIKGVGNKVKTPGKRGFSKSRSGTYTGNINHDYIQAEYEVMAQMKHDSEIAKTIKNIDSNYNIADRVKADAKAKGMQDWKEAIPEGYTTWQPKEGNVFYVNKPVGQEVVEEALNLRGLQLGKIKDKKLKVVLEDIFNALEGNKESLAIGGKRKEFVIKQELADTLNNMLKNKPTNTFAEVAQKVQSAWKSWVLTLNPRSVIKYNIRNFTGDLDAVLAGNPGTIKQIPKAVKELREAFANGSFTPELKSWYDRGGYQSLLYPQEISQANKLKPFERFRDLSIAEKITKPLRSYSEFTKDATNFREAINRYAAYLDYLEQSKKGDLKGYGASKPEIVKGLKTIEDKAFKLSNDLLGAYDEVSEAGQIIRRQFIPFYSWLEVNMKRYKQLFSNAATEGKRANAAGLVGGKLVAKVGLKTAKSIMGIFGLTAALSAWNQLRYPELEETLSDDVKQKPHIILGQDKDGNTIYFSRLGALNDFAEWFGLDNSIQDIKDMLNGKKTVSEQLLDMVKSPANKILTSVSPAYKTPAELMTGKKLYPDVFEARDIKDRTQYAAQALGLGNEYDIIVGKPHRPYLESWTDLLSYKSDPEESSYWDILDAKSDFMKKKTGDSGSFKKNDKSMALYNYKLSLRYKDRQSAKKYLAQYMKLGGTIDGLEKSLLTMDPLYGIPTKYRGEFFSKLTGGEKDKLKLAMKYYGDVLSTK